MNKEKEIEEMEEIKEIKKIKKVLVTATNYSKICKAGKKMLEDQGFEIIENSHGRPLTFEEQRETVGEIYAVVAGVDTWDEEVFKLAPNLKVISRFGVGMDNIDVKKALEYGITVTNCVGANSNAVSEHAMALLLSSVRMVPRLMETTKKGQWERAVYHEFSEMTVGLLGFGAIARLLAQKLVPFGSRLIAYDLCPDVKEAERLGVEMVVLEELLKESDIISIHVPSLPSTYHMINGETIGKMKDGVHLVNTARGPIIDEKALYEGLVSGKLGGAAIDVYENEPVNPNNPLFELPNFIGTPHTAAETYENYDRCGKITAQAIIDVFQGKTPLNLCRQR